MANEFRKVTDQNGVDHPVTDDTRMTWKANGVLGAKSIMEFIAVNETINGVTQTVNDNKSVTINNTATGTCFFKVGRIKGKGSFILNGVTGGSANTYGLTVRTADNQSPSFGAVDNYNGDTAFTIPDNYNDTLYINVRVPSGASVNNVNIKSMLRLGSDPDPTYAPPAMTNKELTEKAIKFVKVLTSADNLNNITETGIYYVIDSAPTNMPEGKLYSFVEVFKENEQAILQRVTRPNNGIIYTRSGSPSTSWNSWYKIEGTVLS